jgi:hypothetical protein
VDGVTVEGFGEQLEKNLRELVSELSGAHLPPTTGAAGADPQG